MRFGGENSKLSSCLACSDQSLLDGFGVGMSQDILEELLIINAG